MLPAAPSQGLCYTFVDEGVAGGDGEGVAGGDLYLSTWCQILLSYWPLQVKWPSTRSPAAKPSGVAFPQPGGADWDNHVPSEPL